MSAEGRREATVDANFVEAITLLNDRGIAYWACHGTLLGLVRDGELIPWDHDIDIAVWPQDLSKASLIDLMTSHGFVVKNDGSDYDFVAFVKGNGREVDFNYYRTPPGSDMAYSEWPLPRSRLTSILSVIEDRSASAGIRAHMLRRLYFARPVARVLIAALKKVGLFYRSAGYTCPAALLEEFEMIEAAGLQIRVPRFREQILEYVYGANWKVPKRQYDWITESPATRISDSRF